MHESQSGAAARLTSLYETHATDAFRYALHLTGRREDAEDVVQFVFLRAYGMLESGTELVNPRAWLIKATKHRSLNLIRDRRETPTAETELATGPQHDPDPAEAEALAEVRSTLWALPESQHHAFVLRHWSGLSQDEIADVLGTTPGAVESLLVRARTALVDDREQGAECAGVRRRLVEALAPIGGQDAHIRSCRRCRTAQSRLLRASEFATAFALVPRPYVAHALATVVPGFGAPAAAATATAATGAAGGGAGAGVATASSAAKMALATKIALATATAIVAVSAAHPVRSAVERVVLGTTHASSAPAPPRTVPAAHAAGGSPPAQGVPAAGSSSHGASSGAPAHGHAPPGKGKAKPAHAAGGAGTTRGKSGTAGSNGNGNANGAGKAKGKSATAGSNGKSAAAGSNGKGVGKPAGAGSKGKATGKAAKAGAATGGSSGSSSPGNGKGNGKG